MGILVALFVFALVITIHEAGHFLVAKWCKVNVLEFALGFGKLLFTKRYGDTKYSLRAIPLGGYVRMAGEDPHAAVPKPSDDKSQVTDEQLASPENWSAKAPDEIEQRLMADRSGWFMNKPVRSRMAIVFAGPLANILSAYVFAVFTLWMFGATLPQDLPVIGQTIVGHPADKAGLKAGDRVVSINGENLSTWGDLSKIVSSSEGKELALVVERKDRESTKTVDIKVTPERESGELAFLEGTVSTGGFKIGVSPAGKRELLGFTDSVTYGAVHIWRLSVLTLRGIGGLIIGEISLKNIGGPIFIFGETMKSAAAGFADLLEFIVFLSVSLAVLNLLPVPVLDGGHLIFLAVEAIKGSPVSLRALEVANQVGMVLLLALTALALSNDFLRLVL